MPIILVLKRFILLLIFINIFITSHAQEVTSDFSVDSVFCKNENINLKNNSSNAQSYLWDFCGKNLNQKPLLDKVATISGLSVPTAITTVYDSGKWYGFLSSRGNDKLFRLNFGDSLSNTPSVTDLGNMGGQLNGPKNMELIRENGTWYGLLINYGGNNLLRLTFPKGLTDTIEVANLGNLSTWDKPRGLDIKNSNDSLVAIISSAGNDKLTLVNFGNSITNTPAGGDIKDIGTGSGLIDGPLGVDIIEDSSAWYGLLASSNNNKLLKLSFGNNLFSEPAIDEVTSLSVPTEVGLKREEGIIKGLTIIRGGNIYGLIFDNGLSNAPTISNHGNYGKLDNTFALNISRSRSEYFGFTVDFKSKEVFRFTFENSCSTPNKLKSTVTEPSGISYDSAGKFSINLTAYDSYGNRNDTTRFIEVLNSEAPSVTFTTNNMCIDNANTFTGSSSNDSSIDTWQWNFGDGNSTTGQEVTHQYNSTGDYQVKLTITTTDGCNNTVTDSIHIYESPSASYDPPSSNLCSNTSLHFENTSNIVGVDSAEFFWDFNGEGSSTATSPDFTFETSGEKTVKLIVELTGCKDSVAHTFTVNKGPAVDFDFTNNCKVGDTIQFNNQTEGDVTDYQWDFGDGNTSTMENPEHYYSTADTFTVKLTATNTEGCKNTYQEDIIVSNAPKASFEASGFTENLPTDFFGKDLTNSQDSVTNWHWNFAGQDTANQQNPSYTFDAPGNYDVTLTVKTEQGCDFDTTKTITIQEAARPTVKFDMPGEVCLNENIAFTNSTVNAKNYLWDFCGENLKTKPLLDTVKTVTGADISTAFTTVYDSGQWYGFLSSRGNNKMFRLDFGDNLSNTPAIKDLGNISNKLNGPKNLELIQENGKWYGLMINFSGNNILRLTFPKGLTDTIKTEDLGNLSTWKNPRGLDLKRSKDSLIAIVSSSGNDKLTLINFGNSITNTPLSGDIKDIGESSSSIDEPLGIEIIKDSSNWYGMLASKSNSKFLKLDFGSDLFNEPAITELASISDPAEVSFKKEGSKYRGLLIANTGKTYGIKFENGVANTPTISDYGNFGTLDNTIALDLVRSGTKYMAFTIDFKSLQMYHFTFEDSCTIPEQTYSKKEVPDAIAFDSSATYPITLTAFDEHSNKDDTTQFITVKDQEAPDISYTTGNQCITTSTSFSGNTTFPDDITSWQWDFGDGTTASGQDVNHQFDTTGTYQVSLTIESSSGCGNFLSKNITIYPPPEPSFSVREDLKCSNQEIQFNNTSEIYGADSLISWHWDFNGQGTDTVKNPVYAFPDGGTKTVTLTAKIPGCEITYDSTFTIEQGPMVDFETAKTNQCEGNTVHFENLTTGDNITQYSWDFGDGNGFTSDTLVSPEHTYDEPGDYLVSLEVVNELGCRTTEEKNITIHAIPKTDFTNELACAGAEVKFNDETTVTGANIVTWQWEFGDGKTANSQDPNHVYSKAGTYQVNLITQSNYGCVDSISKEITVEAPIDADFAYTTQCSDSAYSFNFSDESKVLEDTTTINQWYWQIGNETFTQADPSYQFPEPGDYDVTLTVTSESRCNSTISKTVTVPESPEPNFTFAGGCAGEPVFFEVASTVANDSITGYTWEFPDGGKATIPDPYYFFNEAGTYPVELTITTEKGCNVSISKNVTIHSKPEASFSLSREFGGPPLEAKTTNNSNGAVAYQWLVNGTKQGSEKDTAFTFNETGVKNITLIATSENGCMDTTSRQVKIVDPNMDISLENLQILTGNGSQNQPTGNPNGLKLLLTMKNKGNIPVEDMAVELSLGNITLEENFTTSLPPGASANHTVNFTLLQKPGNNIEVVCARLKAQLKEYAEKNTGNNENCANLNEAFYTMEPFPNPAREKLELKFVLPIKDDVHVEIRKIDGRIIRSTSIKNTQSGLNNHAIEISQLSKGVYIVSLKYQGRTHRHKIVVVP